MPVNHLNTWTKEEDAKLRAEIARERSVGTIALLHHRTKTAIRFRLKHLGLEENRPYLLVKGDMDENDDDDDLLG